MSKLTKREYRQLAHKNSIRRGKKFRKIEAPVDYIDPVTEAAEFLTSLAEEEATQEAEEREEVLVAGELE